MVLLEQDLQAGACKLHLHFSDFLVAFKFVSIQTSEKRKKEKKKRVTVVSFSKSNFINLPATSGLWYSDTLNLKYATYCFISYLYLIFYV